MNEINELKEKLIARRMKWMRSETTQDYVISDMMDLLIGITEHLEAIKTTGPDKLTLCSLKSAERQGALKALRWVRRCVDLNPQIEINTAIARLENGGDL